MQNVPVVAIGIAVIAIPAEAMRRVLMQSEIMRADVAAAEAAHMSAAKAASHVAAAKTSSMTAATAVGVGRAGEQTRSEKGGCQHCDGSFHRNTPFSQVDRRRGARIPASHAHVATDDWQVGAMHNASIKFGVSLRRPALTGWLTHMRVRARLFDITKEAGPARFRRPGLCRCSVVARADQ
jgi:hypothetical protein